MTRRDLDILPDSFAMCLVNLFTAFGKELDRPTGLLYWRALHDVPVPLLEAAVGKAVREHVYGNPPRPALLRQFAETCRVEIRQRFAWTSCGRCSAQGWIEREIDGVTRAVRCDCFEQHARTLREIGADGPALTAPAVIPDSDVQDTRLLAAGDQ